jgi:TolB-like protein
MKRANILLISLTLLVVPLALYAVPQVAVLDAVLAAGIDPTVASPITDKIIEEMVNSGKFRVIDRANIERVLREKEFQLSSGIVRNEEVRRAGEYLGADYVIVANVTRVGSTYVISAKMIDVVSGEIASQASAEKEGKIDIVLQLARAVGAQISGQPFLPPVVAEGTPTPEKKPAEQPVAKPETKIPAAAQDPAAMAKVQALIKAKAHMRTSTRGQIVNLSQSLSDNDRTLLYTTNKKDNATTALLLNLLLTSLGSFVQGDVGGGVTELLGVSLTIAGLANGYTEYYDYYYGYYYSETNAFYWIGVGSAVFTVVYMCVRPFTFQKTWNKNLAEALGVPYLSLLDLEGSGFNVQMTPSGPETRFNLNLVSLQY